MYKLIYKSTASPNLKKEDIVDILKTAREFNGEHEISGCLIYYNGKFLQILEGDKAIVEELYGRIQKDKRHFNVKLTGDGYYNSRIFSNWSMAFVGVGDLNNIENELFKSNLNFLSLFQNDDDYLISELFWEEVRSILE